MREDKNLQKVKNELLQRKKELQEMLTTLANEKITDDQVQDSADQVSTSTAETLRNSLESAELLEFNRVLSALQAVEEGTYGICSDCGEAISEKRLKVYPDAVRCIACQEALEK